MNKKAAIIAGVAIIGLVGAFALTGNKGTQDTAVAGDEVIKITHDLGETDVKTNPQRVVVFDYPALDTLNALGIDTVVGLPSGSKLPEGLEKYSSDEYTNVGTLKEPDLEAVKSANPDLIIISGRQADYYDQLKEIAPTISVAKENSDYVGSMIENIKELGKIFGVEDKATEEVAKLEEKIAEVKGIVEAKGANALTVMVNEGNLSVYGDESRFALLYQGFGFTNVDETIDNSTHGQTVTFEYLAETNPEYIFVLDRGAATGGESTAKDVLDNEIVKSTDAYKNDKIVYLNPVVWYTNDGGLNSVNTMIEDVMNGLK
ncbi:MAG: siderophore ABC transporter substrate-binding protein [Peptostreptococcaceae bacterium]